MLGDTIIILIDVLLIILIAILISAMLWKSIRNFFHENYSYFDFFFIVMYFTEQLSLIILLVIKPEYTTFWVSVFALIVITTASIQKLGMDSRDRKIRELNVKYGILLEEAGKLYEDSKEREKLHINTINKLTEKLKEK